MLRLGQPRPNQGMIYLAHAVPMSLYMELKTDFLLRFLCKNVADKSSLFHKLIFAIPSLLGLLLFMTSARRRQANGYGCDARSQPETWLGGSW